MKAIIIGFMGSGKTTVSRLLAQKLGCRASILTNTSLKTNGDQ